MPSSRSMLPLTTMKWCKFTSEVEHLNSGPFGRWSSRGRILPPSSISSRCCWSRRIMFKQEAMCKKATCSIRISMEEEEKIMEEEADSVGPTQPRTIPRTQLVLPSRHFKRCRGNPRVCVETGWDHLVLGPRSR